MSVNRDNRSAVCRYGNAVILLFFGIYLFIIPGIIVIRDVRDPNLQGKGIPRCAFRLHRSLSPKYERWAHGRIASGAAAAMDKSNISGTEWPLFGSVFYLWATDALQQAWEKDNSLSPVAPREYARGAVEAAAALLTDPKHAAWVRRHWGEDYLHRENVFYRMLLIGGLTSYSRLQGGDKYLPLLRDQVETLSKALDESPHGLLDDYPGECYPGDVLAAIACIKRADAVLGTEHSAFVERAVRGFEGDLLDSLGLPPYDASSENGRSLGMSRGCGNSYVTLFAPELWPERAKEWYAIYEEHFWEHSWTAVGFREFPKDERRYEWWMDVDSGPVVAGLGVSACAFGVGAARANGRFDHAYPLSAEMIAASWPLPHGTLAGPRILSSATDAPYLGEAAVLYQLTRQPVGDLIVKRGGRLPGFFYIVVCGYFAIGLFLVGSQLLGIRRWRRAGEKLIPAVDAQVNTWAILIAAAIGLIAWGQFGLGLILILCAQFLPRWKAKVAGE